MDAMTPDDRRYYDEKFTHVCELLEQHEKLDQQRHAAEDGARDLASKDVNRRLQEMNEFRVQLSEERASYVPRREHDLLAERIKELEIARGEQMGKAAAYASIAGFIGVAASLLMHFWK